MKERFKNAKINEERGSAVHCSAPLDCEVDDQRDKRCVKRNADSCQQCDRDGEEVLTSSLNIAGYGRARLHPVD